MKIKTLVAISCFVLGCKSLNPASSSSLSSSQNLQDAQRYFEAGEWHQAKIITQGYLARNPESEEGQRLMGEILDRELARHREIFDGDNSEEFDESDKKAAIKTWLERSRSLLEIHHYDEAALAAENVFLYDPDNGDASDLMDEIQKKALREGKRDILSGQKVTRMEIDDRVSLYKQQARTWYEAGQWGAARLAAEKVLLLSPEDSDALEILEEIRSRQES